MLFVAVTPTIPTINVYNDSIFGCEGQKTLLVSSFSKKYKWSNGDINQSVLIDKSGEYSVIVTDTNGCENISSKTIYVQLVKCNGISSPNFEKIRIYPNPVSNILNIECESFENTTVYIKNNLGQVIFESCLNNYLTSLYLDNLEIGLYYINIGNTDFNQKFTILR